MSPTVSLAQTRSLNTGDFLTLPEGDRTEVLTNRFYGYWNAQLRKPNPSFTFAFCMTFWKIILRLNIFLALECVVQLVSPYMLGRVVYGLQSGAPQSELYLDAMGLSLSILM